MALRSNKVAPATAADVAMAKKHNAENIAVDRDHMQEHRAAAKKAAPGSPSKRYNTSHAQGHAQDIQDRKGYSARLLKIGAQLASKTGKPTSDTAEGGPNRPAKAKTLP